MLKGIKVRIYPDYLKQTEINKLLGCSRFVYNYSLNLKSTTYKESKTNLSTSDLNKEIIKLKNTDTHIWLKDAHSKVIQQSLIDLDKSYNNFFKNGSGFPKFKSKCDDNKCRFPIDAIIGIKGNRISLTNKLKDLHFKSSVKDEKFLNSNRDIKSVTLSKTKSGKYFLSILIDRPNKVLPETMKMVGIDIGIKDFIVTSDNLRFENIKTIRNNQDKLKQLNRRLSKTTKGSKNREKARIKLAKYNEKLKNIKINYLHNIVNTLLNENQVVVREDLNVVGMLKNHRLSRSIQELSIGEFKRILDYKSNWYDRTIIVIDRWFASSKICNCCKVKNTKLKLSDRTWTCICGIKHDRDLNASNNILEEGIKIGLSKPKFKPVENIFGNQDDLMDVVCSTNQEVESVKIDNVFEV